MKTTQLTLAVLAPFAFAGCASFAGGPAPAKQLTLKAVVPGASVPGSAAPARQLTLNAVLPGSAYPRQLIAIDGDQGKIVVWDPGPNQQNLSIGLFGGTRYFQVPENATAGVHQVAIMDEVFQSLSVPITVLPKSNPHPEPRIEDVALFAVKEAAGQAKLWVTVSAANLDIGAQVEVFSIQGQQEIAHPVLEPKFWSALPTNYFLNHDPDTFAYPVFHYGQLLFAIEDIPGGTTLQIRVQNVDGKQSALSEYAVLLGTELDRDGDAIPDAAESAPSGFASDFGATPLRKDILIEVDWMASAAPPNQIWSIIESVFTNAPVLNPDGSPGFHIAIDRGQGGVFSEGGTVLIDVDEISLDPLGTFDQLKSMPVARADFFHYCIIAREDPEGSSGDSEVNGGNDFYVALEGPDPPETQLAIAGTFVHELGHNLGLRHGGNWGGQEDKHFEFKPNLPSTMSYRYQYDGISVDCDLTPDGYHDFSEGMMMELHEHSIDESVGICDGQWIDFDENNTVTPAGPLNMSKLWEKAADGDENDVYRDYDQWSSLKFECGFDWLD